MRIEEPQLLATMNRVERVVNVERDPPWDLPEGSAIKIDHGAAHAGRPNPSVIFLHHDANKQGGQTKPLAHFVAYSAATA